MKKVKSNSSAIYLHVDAMKRIFFNIQSVQ